MVANSTNEPVTGDTRDLLIGSALKLFDKKGYPRTSVEDIVEAAGLTKGAFYHHFDSKEEVLEIIHNVYVDNQIAYCKQVLEECTDPRERLRRVAVGTILNLGEYRAHVSVYLQDRRFLTGDRQRNISKKRREIDDLFHDIIKEGMEAGYFRSDISAKLTSFGLIGMYAWVINWWRPDGSLSLTEIGEQYADLVLNGLAKHD